MIGFDIGGPEAIIVLVIVLVLFGGSQIPKLARNLGRAQKEFKDGIDEGSAFGHERHRYDPLERLEVGQLEPFGELSPGGGAA